MRCVDERGSPVWAATSSMRNCFPARSNELMISATRATIDAGASDALLLAGRPNIPPKSRFSHPSL